jgi:hypothetical protein
MTPTNRLETNLAMKALELPSQNDRTRRQIFNKTTIRIERLQFELVRTGTEL